MAKTLRKRMKKLDSRRQARDIAVANAEKSNPGIDWQKALRRPGSVTK